MQKRKIIILIILLAIAISFCVAGMVIKNRTMDTETPTSTEKESNMIITDMPIIIVDDVSGKPGDKVQIAVKIKNNPGILGMVLTAYFDESKCSLLSVENGKALKDILDFTPSKELCNGAKFVWDGTEIMDDDKKDGEILLMNFKILDAEGSIPITLKYFDGDIVDNNLLNLYPQIENGNIIISN